MFWSRPQIRSKNAATRQAAADKLSRMASAKAVPTLIDALADADAEVRRQALRVLTGHRHPAIAAALLKLATDPDTLVRAQARRGLDQLGWRPTTPAEKAAHAILAEDMRAAADHQDAAVPILASVVAAGPAARSVAAIAALGQIEDPQVEAPLLASLKHPAGPVRAAAAEALSRRRNPKMVALIKPLLADAESRVRGAAAEALGRLGGPEAGEAVFGSMQDHSWEVRRSVIFALGMLGDTKAVAKLAEALRDGDRDVREAAANALGTIKDHTSFGPLVLTLLDTDGEVRRAAEFSLIRNNPRWIMDTTMRLIHPELVQALYHHEYWVRHSAAKILMKMSKYFPDLPMPDSALLAQKPLLGNAVSSLSELLGDDDPCLRFAAVEALRSIDDPRAGEAIEHASHDGNIHVKQAALRALQGAESPKSPLG